MLRWQLFSIKNFPGSTQTREPPQQLGPPILSMKKHYHLSHLLFRLKYSLGRHRWALSLSDNVHRLFPERSLRPLQLQCPGCLHSLTCTCTSQENGQQIPDLALTVPVWHTSAMVVTAKLPTQIHGFSCGPSHAKSGLCATRISSWTFSFSTSCCLCFLPVFFLCMFWQILCCNARKNLFL